MSRLTLYYARYLPVEPSIQKVPLLYQAGTSTAGIKFGARHAEAVFMSGPSVKKVSILAVFER